MPIMRPEHQQAMRAAQKILAEVGVEGARKPAERDSSESTPIREMLEDVGLSLEETLQELAMVAKGNNEGLRTRALETVLKMHGALKESAAGPAAPSFTINIIDSKAVNQTPLDDLNLPEGVNPIFVPRQLHSPKQTTN